MYLYEKGQGLVEYALIIVLVAIIVILAINFMAPTLGNVFTSIGNTLEGIWFSNTKKSLRGAALEQTNSARFWYKIWVGLAAWLFIHSTDEEIPSKHNPASISISLLGVY